MLQEPSALTTLYHFLTTPAPAATSVSACVLPFDLPTGCMPAVHQQNETQFYGKRLIGLPVGAAVPAGV
jgi:hypothetical protein